MNTYTYAPKGVCSFRIDFSLDGDTLHGISFEGGCDGNLKAISKLLEGTDARRAAAILRGNTCGGKPTSCADQLALAIQEALDREENEGRQMP